MDLTFSIVIPTRHRPEFIKESLKYIKRQSYKKYEVIVCDNYTDGSLSCERYCKESGIKTIKYIKPAHPLGMVENWNTGLNYATGDYVLYLTDKMFLLPNTLKNLNAIAIETKAEIINWVDDMYSPNNYTDYFGEGIYSKSLTGVPDTEKYCFFDPIEELSLKGDATVARQEQSKSEYARGKICFGAYSKELIDRLKSKYEKLFYNITPDYTSMIIGLSEAKSAVEMAGAGIVHLNTDISNGKLAKENDESAKKYLSDLEEYHLILDTMLVKGLYSSVNNMVARDYLFMKDKLAVPFRFNRINWLLFIQEDIFSVEKKWSSQSVKDQQIGLYDQYVASLNSEEKRLLEETILVRKAQKKKSIELAEEQAKQLARIAEQKEIERQQEAIKRYEANKRTVIGRIRELIKSILPESVKEKIRELSTGKRPEPAFEKDLLNAVIKYKQPFLK